MPDTRSTEDAAKDSLPGNNPEVNKAAGDRDAPRSADKNANTGKPD